MTFADVELPHLDAGQPRGAAIEALCGQLNGWIRSRPLLELAEHWGATPPSADTIAALYAWYEKFSHRWDFRGQRERDEARKVDVGEKADLVTAAARALGLKDPRPPKLRRYDATLILGGLARACVLRPQYAAELHDTGVSLGDVVALGGYRPLGAKERELADKYGFNADNELEFMVEGVRQAFAVTEAPVMMNPASNRGNADWQVVQLGERIRRLEVLAAPSSEPLERRANTPDTLRWWAERQGDLSGKRVLVLTSTIYVPYQNAAAIEMLALGYGADVEVVGVPDGVHFMDLRAASFAASDYLQEIRSAIAGNASLLRAAARES